MAALLWGVMMMLLWALLRPRFDVPAAAPSTPTTPTIPLVTAAAATAATASTKPPPPNAPTPATAAWAWTRPRLLTLAVFAAAVLGWVGGAPLARALGIAGEVDTWVALAALLALVVLGGLRWSQAQAGIPCSGKGHLGRLSSWFAMWFALA